MFSSIVVGTDGSSSATAAVRRAAQLARQCGATLHIVCAYRVRALALTGGGDGVSAVPVTTEGELEEEARRVLDDVHRLVGGDDLVVNTYAAPGNPAEAIIDVAQTQRADLIVVGSKGMTGPRRLLGSVPNTVSHHAGTSVLIVRTT
jgi:nucleotide-binding universal stress UspA family protein